MIAEVLHCTAAVDWVTSRLKMASVQVLVFLLGLVVLCHSDCFVKRVKFCHTKKVCIDDDGKHYPVKSEWQKDCMDCSCAENMIRCCNKIPGNNVQLPAKCEFLVDRAKCTFKAVLKSDNSKSCF